MHERGDRRLLGKSMRGGESERIDAVQGPVRSGVDASLQGRRDGRTRGLPQQLPERSCLSHGASVSLKDVA